MVVMRLIGYPQVTPPGLRHPALARNCSKTFSLPDTLIPRDCFGCWPCEPNMSSRIKLIAAAGGVALIVILTPIVRSAFGASGYYVGGRCACGNETFIRIERDAYFKYSPGHSVPEERAFSLRAHGTELEVLAVRPPDGAWASANEGQVLAKLRFQDGALYESWAGSTNWVRHERVHNPWRVWLAKLLDK